MKKTYIQTMWEFIQANAPKEQVERIMINENSRIDCVACAESKIKTGFVCDIHYHDYQDCERDDCLMCVHARLKNHVW